MIELRRVRKEYGERKCALRDVSFTVDKGEFAFLTGHSGSGKSTAMRLVHMAERPTSGEVLAAGFHSDRVTRKNLWQVRRRIGFVFQDFRLLPNRSAIDNIVFVLRVMDAPRREIRPRAQHILTQVGLAPKAGALVHELSGGERQRVCIARALAGEPHVLLADEPTGNLDRRATDGILEIFSDINAAGTTVLMATHDLDIMARIAEARRFVLSHGELVEGE